MTGEYPTFVTRAEAIGHLERVRVDLRDFRDIELVKPGSGITGRVVAREIVAPVDIPPQDRAMMDGFAIQAGDEYPLEIVTDVFPEDESDSIVSGTAARIRTGGPLPEGTNAVIRTEDTTVKEGRLWGPDVAPGAYTYQQGSNVTSGECLYEDGDHLRAKDAILFDDIGLETVPVYRPLQIGILATGTEIADDASMDRDSNMLLELFESWGTEPTFEGVTKDDPEAVRDSIDELSNEYDVVVTSGGTSRGSKDYVVQALDALGSILFHGVQFRPGKSLAAARLEKSIAFAVPGKPLAAYTSATMILRSVFTGTSRLPTVGATFPVDLEMPDPSFTYAVPVMLQGGTAIPLGHKSSELHIYDDVYKSSVLSSATSVVRGDGAILADEPISAGEQVSVVPYESLE